MILCENLQQNFNADKNPAWRIEKIEVSVGFPFNYFKIWGDKSPADTDPAL